jgi:hypothetical protein
MLQEARHLPVASWVNQQTDVTSSENIERNLASRPIIRGQRPSSIEAFDPNSNFATISASDPAQKTKGVEVVVRPEPDGLL